MDNISPEQEAEKRTDGCNRSENAQMVISERKWSPALQWEQNAGRFEVVEVITGSLCQTMLALPLIIHTYKCSHCPDQTRIVLLM